MKFGRRRKKNELHFDTFSFVLSLSLPNLPVCIRLLLPSLPPSAGSDGKLV